MHRRLIFTPEHCDACKIHCIISFHNRTQPSYSWCCAVVFTQLMTRYSVPLQLKERAQQIPLLKTQVSRLVSPLQLYQMSVRHSIHRKELLASVTDVCCGATIEISGERRVDSRLPYNGLTELNKLYHLLFISSARSSRRASAPQPTLSPLRAAYFGTVPVPRNAYNRRIIKHENNLQYRKGAVFAYQIYYYYYYYYYYWQENGSEINSRQFMLRGKYQKLFKVFHFAALTPKAQTRHTRLNYVQSCSLYTFNNTVKTYRPNDAHWRPPSQMHTQFARFCNTAEVN